MRIALVVLLLVVACKPKKPDGRAGVPEGCLDLPHEQRRGLQAHPDGSALYWFERVASRNFDASDISTERLVRYDLASKQLTVVAQPIYGPVHFAKDGGVLAIVKYEYQTLVHIRDGRVQSLVPDYFDVKDVEMIDDNKLAMLVGADGKWSIFQLDLDSPRPVHVTDANTLLSAVRGTVYVRDDDKQFAVDLATGAREPRDVPSSAMPEHDHVYFVEDKVVKTRSLVTNDVKTLVEDRRAWSLLHQATSVLARAGSDTNQHAFTLVNGTATELPRIRGGTSIVGTAQIGDKLWALIGHNTSHYDGDLWELPHESDVCLLDAAESFHRYDTRHLPARYAAREKAFWAAAEKHQNMKWQIFEYQGDPPTLSIEVDEDGGTDLDAMRARVRDVHKTVTRLFDDDELRTTLLYRDGRVATYRWRRERLRPRTTVGIGDLELTDPADFDLELADVVDEKSADGKHVTCSGKVTSLRTVTLLDLQVRCIAGDLERVITIPKLEAKQTHAFAKTFDALDNDYLVVELFRGRNQLVVRNLKFEARNRALHDFFTKLDADTKLALNDHERSKKFRVRLETRPNVEIGDVDLADVKQAYERITAARALFELDEEDPDAPFELELQIHVARKTYNWDGETLTLAE